LVTTAVNAAKPVGWVERSVTHQPRFPHPLTRIPSWHRTPPFLGSAKVRFSVPAAPSPGAARRTCQGRAQRAAQRLGLDRFEHGASLGPPGPTPRPHPNFPLNA
jgi:hypothetical protein